MYEDDLEEETLQADAGPVEKQVINEACTLLSIATTDAQSLIENPPLHDESVIAVRDKTMDVGDEMVSDEDGCLSRNMMIKAYDQIAAGLLDFPALDTSCAFDAKNQGFPINEVCL